VVDNHGLIYLLQTATTLHIMLQLIAQKDEIQEKLYEELKSVIPTKCTKLNSQMLRNLPYLKACINEAFRMVPVAPNLVRISEEPMNLNGYHIPPHVRLFEYYYKKYSIKFSGVMILNAIMLYLCLYHL